MKKEPCVFFTIVDDRYYHPVGTEILINSFKKFHPDIDFVVFRQDMIDKVFSEKHINFYNAKPTFAKLLVPHYERIVNIDADSIILGKLDEIIEGDYDVGCPTNYNDYENMSLEDITEKQFVQAGLVASSNPKFWDIWELANKEAMKYPAQENSILNLLWYHDPIVSKMKLKIFDQDKDYYGCKSLNREKEFYIKDGKVMCRGEQVFCYHVAKGGANMPKFQFEKMGFTDEVIEHMLYLGYYGSSLRLGGT
jgi:hypothetical protein